MSDLDSIRSRLPMADLMERLGFAVPHKGNMLCPFHDDRTASFHVYEDSFYCFGCQASGDIFSFYQRKYSVAFIEALRACADMAGVKLDTSPEQQRKLEAKRRVQDMLTWAALWYASRYAGSPAQIYAQSRQLDADNANLGYASSNWTDLVNALTNANIDLTQAEEAGLIKQGKRGYYDHFRNRLIIPMFERGICTYLTGRDLSGDTDTPKYLHIGLAEPPLYHLNGALKAGSQPILTESISDTLRMSVDHLPAVGLYGKALHDHHIARLKRFDQVYLAMHNDTAGRQLADSAAQALGESLILAPPPEGIKDWADALNGGHAWEPDDTLTWVRWKLRTIDPTADQLSIKREIAPILDYLITLDASTAAIYLNELKAYFGWQRDVFRGYEVDLKKRRAEHTKQQTEQRSVKHDDSGASINIKPTPTFINPAQAYHDGVVYVAQQLTRRKVVQTKFGKDEFDVYQPVIITSNRQLLDPPELPSHAPAGTLIYLNDAETLALRRSVDQASSAWSYDSIAEFLRGDAPTVTPHDLYQQLIVSLKKYVYFDDQGDYVIAALWAMGTYFHQQFDAFPYLVVNGHKGAGKTTLLHWLNHIAFSAMHLVNTSEAALYRWIESAAPTLLIDEQEGLNSRKAGKEDKADLMGLLKAGYQRGALVTRQDPNSPAVTQTFSVYCPKALAAVEQFEDILSDRGILVYMPKVSEDVIKNAGIQPRNQMLFDDFTGLRNNLYLLLMQWSDELNAIKPKIKNSHAARFGELVYPLLVIAALVDASRDGQRNVLNQLEIAIANQAQKRIDRNDTTPEYMLKTAIEIVIVDAVSAGIHPEPSNVAQLMADGTIIMDSLHIHEAFRSLFPNGTESYFNSNWLAKEVAKTPYIRKHSPDRWRREVFERDPLTNDVKQVKKQLSVYSVDPRKM